MNVLVLHGPDLTLPVERINGLLRTRAAELGVTVKIFQTHHEGALLDQLQAERAWADGVLINPASLTHTSYVLRDALVAVGKPAVEVHLTDIRRRESWRRKSLIKDVCLAQVLGKGVDSYLIGLERLANHAGPTRRTAVAAPSKTLGRSPPKAKSMPAAAKGKEPAKTLGRAGSSPVRQAAAAGILTRALVRQKIADRLAGKLSPAGLSTWARAQWLDVQRGAPAESGQRELLEDSLQTLVLSATPASRLTDEQLVELMTQLDG